MEYPELENYSYELFNKIRRLIDMKNLLKILGDTLESSCLWWQRF